MDVQVTDSSVEDTNRRDFELDLHIRGRVKGSEDYIRQVIIDVINNKTKFVVVSSSIEQK